MIKIPVYLRDMYDAKHLVQAASGCRKDVELICGRYIVDAKSMLGVFSLPTFNNVEIGAEEEDVRKVEKIAHYVGIAFQIQDDILDVTSTEEVLGKPIHSDEKNQKTTYVTLKGIEQAHKDVERMTEEAIDELKKFPAGDNFLEQLLKSLVYREK